MFNFVKRATSAIVAGAVVLGSLAVYPIFTKNKEQTVVRAAELPAVMDAASSVNYSTILGRGVDYGIVAENFQQRDHMESTFAVINFSKIPATVGTYSTIDLNPVGSTAQVLVNSLVTSGTVFGTEVAGPKYLLIEGNKNNVLNIEGKSQIYTDGYYQFQNFKDEVRTTNDNTEGNIRLIMGDAFSASDTITYKVNNGYAIDYHDYYKVVESTGYLDLTKGDFANKVVYIKVDNELMKKIGVDNQFKIIKDSSTVVVFHIDSSVEINAKNREVSPMNGLPRPIGKDGNDKQDYVLLNKYSVSIDGGNSWISSGDYSGRYSPDGTESDDLKKTKKCDQEICQKIIWNITTDKPVALENTSGLFIAPNTFVETQGTSAGWIVAKDFANSQGEWHYIYGGGSQNVLYDEKGEIHFAANKTFTHAWNGEKTEQDTTIYTAPKTYSFYWYENDSNFSITDPQNLSDTQREIVYNTATNKLQFPILKFFNSQTEADNANLSDHYIPKGDEGKTFYYTIREVGAGTTNSDGIQISTGYIDIILTVKNIDGKLSYYVYSETYLGDGSYYENNAGTPTVGNDADYKGKKVRQTRMSGIEFFLGECFNLAETSIDLKKTVTGDYTPAAGETFTYYVYNKALNKYYYLDADGKLASSDEKIGVKVEYGLDKVTKLTGLPIGEYTVSEDFADATRRAYTLTPPADKDVKVNLTSTPVVNLVNQYKTNYDEVGKIILTKTIKGLVTDEDLAGLKFTLTDEATGTVVWEHKLSDSVFKVTTDSAGNKKYTAEIENLNLTKTYKVLETLYTPEGYKFVQLSYTIGTNAAVTGDYDAEGIKPTADGINVDYTNEYSRITGKLVVDKKLMDGNDDITANNAGKEYKFTVAVGDNLGYLQENGMVGSKAHEFTVKAGTTLEIPVDYSAFNKDLKVTEITTALPDIPGYAFESGTSSFATNRKSVNGQVTELNAVITNKYTQTPTPVGTVVISKTISGAELADFEKIEFKVKVDDVEYPGLIPELSTTTVGTTVGQDWVKETDGKYTYTITNVPLNTKYEVEETIANFLGEASNKYTFNSGNSITTGEVTVTSSTATNEIVLKNAYDVNTGSIVLSKTISGAELADFETIHFTVKADGVEVTTVPDLTTANVTPGKWIDEGNGKYTYTISNVPVNTVYDVTETLATFKDTTISNKYTLNTADSTLNGSNKVLEKGESYEIALTNAYDVNTGTVVITKSISGAPLEDFETIHFDVTADGKAVAIPDLSSDNVGSVEGTDWIKTGNDTYTFTIKDVPVGTKYEVTENLTSTKFKDSVSTTYTLDTNNSKTKADGTVETKDQTVDLILKNTYVTPAATGSLVISKTISGADLEDFERLSFTVVNTADSTDTIDIPDLTTANVTPGKWTDAGNGKYTYTVEGLEAGKTYKVTETYDGLGTGTASTTYELDTSKTTKEGSGKIVAGGEVKVELTDAYKTKTTPVATGSVVISKTISGAPLADFEQIKFTVTADGNPVSVPVLNKDAIGTTVGTDWIDAGSGTYTFTIKDVPEGTVVSVTETLASVLGTVTTKYELDSSSVTSGSKTVEADKTATIALTNIYKEIKAPTPAPVKTGSLVITKTISGTPLNELETISFVVENADDSSDTHDVPDLTIANVNNGTWTSDGSGTYTYTIPDLTAGEKYVVIETYNGTEGSTEYILSSSSTTDGTGTIKEGGEVIVELTDKYEAKTTPVPVPPQPEYGTIEITKTILGVDAADLDGSAIIFDIDGPSDFNDGKTLTVSYDEFVNGRWTMEDVPVGSYKVSERGNGASSVYPLISTEVNGSEATGTSQTLEKDGMVSFAFVNTYDDTVSGSTGTIEITKTLSGAYAKDINAAGITFTVKGPDTYNGGSSKTITYSDFVDGRWSEEDVPVGEYTVTETANGETQTFVLVSTTVNGAAKTSDTDTLTADGIVTFAFVNTYNNDTTVPGPSPATSGSLTINKVLAGDYPYYASDKTFFFIVEGPSYPDGITVHIKGSGSVTLDDLIPGDYTVAEVEAKADIDGYSVSVSGNGATVTVAAGDDADCTITNSYTEIKSTPTDTPTPAPDSGLKLTFEKKDEIGTLIANAVLTLTSEDGYDLSGVKVTQNGVSVDFTISEDKASISFSTVDTAPSIVSGLFAGSYELKETVTPEGYLTADSIHFVLNDDGSYTKDLEVIVAGSPVVMVDRADPTYNQNNNPDKFTDREIDNHKDRIPDFTPDNTPDNNNPNNNKPDNNKPSGNPKTNSGNGAPIPATGEQKSYFAAAGVMLLGLCAAIIAGLGIYRKKKSDN